MKLFFGGVVAIVLLGLYLYLYLIRVAIQAAECAGPPSCIVFNDGMAQSLSTISGLVSALLIAILATTDPGDPPLKRLFADEPKPIAKRAMNIVAGVLRPRLARRRVLRLLRRPASFRTHPARPDLARPGLAGTCGLRGLRLLRDQTDGVSAGSRLPADDAHPGTPCRSGG